MLPEDVYIVIYTEEDGGAMYYVTEDCYYGELRNGSFSSAIMFTSTPDDQFNINALAAQLQTDFPLATITHVGDHLFVKVPERVFPFDKNIDERGYDTYYEYLSPQVIRSQREYESCAEIIGLLDEQQSKTGSAMAG